MTSAGILRSASSPGTNSTSSTFSVIDLGFGCGDQSLYFKNHFSGEARAQDQLHATKRLKAYVGITLDRDQFGIAQERLDQDPAPENTLVKLYRADAGKADAWSPELAKDVATACQPDDPKVEHENWILGLDTLYHFQPSKWPVIDYACTQLGASLMAYDLCMADNLSFWHRLVLRIMAFLGHSPFVNWATMEEYRERLIKAGYDPNKIEIIDISEHVFRPLARFMRRREIELKRYGMSIGRFKHGTAMFDWWGRSGVVKGCIIIARK